MTNLVKIFFIIVYTALVVTLGIYYPIILNLTHISNLVDLLTTICQIAFFVTPIFGVCISMSKLDKKEKREMFTGLVIGLGVVLFLYSVFLVIYDSL